MDASGYGDRIFAGLMSYQAVHGRTGLAVIGERVARLEGRKEPYSKAAVSGWISEKSEPRLLTFMAIARLFGGMPSWYAFNYGEAPDNPVTASMDPVQPSGKKKKRGAR